MNQLPVSGVSGLSCSPSLCPPSYSHFAPPKPPHCSFTTDFPLSPHTLPPRKPFCVPVAVPFLVAFFFAATSVAGPCHPLHRPSSPYLDFFTYSSDSGTATRSTPLLPQRPHIVSPSRNQHTLQHVSFFLPSRHLLSAHSLQCSFTTPSGRRAISPLQGCTG